jgi:dienelactone hydrolase
VRDDLEASVACYGFPQRYLGRFKDAKAPILAIYGSDEPFVAPDVVAALRRELADSALEHEVVILDGARRDFLSDHLVPDDTHQPGSIAWDTMLAFLEKHRIAPIPHHDAPGM